MFKLQSERMTEGNGERQGAAATTAAGDPVETSGGPTIRASSTPSFDYEDLSKEALVRLVREYGLIVHLLDRSMCAAIGMKYGADAVKELAIEEWAGASPSTATDCARS